MTGTRVLLGLGMLFAGAAGAQAQAPYGATNGDRVGAWGDQGDGTYANPILPADFSDLDAIRVGTEFYAISSTFQYSPGMAVLRSRDLVNWEMAGHVVEDLTRLDPELNWDRMGRAGRGIWAGSLRFHGGRFRVYFGTPDGGIYMSSAARVEGPWTPVKVVLAGAGWDDPCPFWDDDGQGYLVTTRFAAEGEAGTKYNIHLFKMTAAGEGLVAGWDRVIHQSRGSEANKLYKIGGMYLHYFSEVKKEGRVAMMERAKSLAGPWEIRQLNHVAAAVDKEPNQGGLMELADGRWYFLSHQGHGDWEGRAAVLLPVTWVEGWPVIGEPGADGIGNMVWEGKKPIAGFAPTIPVASDDFAGGRLRPEWEWNYQPRAGMWSLAERPGWLRLHAFAAIEGRGFGGVGDVLTQRAMRTAMNEVTVKMDVKGMVAGQEAGLVHYAKAFCTLRVVKDSGGLRISTDGSGGSGVEERVGGDVVWLRSTWGFDGVSRFSFSGDGRQFRPMGEACGLTWGSYRGDRVGLYTTGAGGSVDFGFFRYEVQR